MTTKHTIGILTRVPKSEACAMNMTTLTSEIQNPSEMKYTQLRLKNCVQCRNAIETLELVGLYANIF